MTNTVSLELAKELLELGLKIETEKWWIIYDRECECVYIKYHEELADVNNYYPAYSTDELLAVLPETIPDPIYLHQLTIRKDIDGYFNVHYGPKILCTRKGLPEALGLLCKYLLEQGYVLKDGILTK
mgnify:FL=1